MDGPSRLILKGNKPHVGSWLRKLRGDRTLQDLAAIAKVDASTISKWESSREGVPKATNICLYASALGLTPHELLGWNGKVTAEDAWRFTVAAYGYEIQSVSRVVNIALDGSATVVDKVAGIRNFTSAELKFVHKVAWGRLEPGAQRVLEESAGFDWEPRELHERSDRRTILRILDVGLNGCERHIWIPPTDEEHSFTCSHICRGMYRLFEGDLHDQTAETDPWSMEWCRFYIDKPIKRLHVLVNCDLKYRVESLHRAVWNSDSPFSPHRLKTNLLKSEGHFEKQEYDLRSGRMGFTVAYPAHGFSYGIVWTLIDEREFGDLFPDHKRPARVCPMRIRANE